MLPIVLVNPSAVLPMRLSTEDRKTADDVAPEAEAARPVRPPDSPMTVEEHREYSSRGADLVPAKNGAGHEVQLPRYQANGFSSLAEYVTACFQQSLRPSYQAAPPKGLRVLDDWKAAVPAAVIAPGGRTEVTLTEGRRWIAECASPEEVGLRIEIVDPRRTVRLRSRHAKSGVQENVAFVSTAGNNCGTLTLDKAHVGIIELMPL